MWFKFFKIVMEPENASPEDRRRYGRVAGFITYMGLLYVAAGLAALAYWAIEKRSFGAAPMTPVAVQDLVPQSFEGRLQEARVEGFLQLGEMIEARNINGNQRVLIPLTQDGWETGDPVTVYLQTHLFLYDQRLQTSGEIYETTLARFGLPPSSHGATLATLPVRRPATAIDGIAFPPQTIFVDFFWDTRRQFAVRLETGGKLALARIFLAMGAVFAGIGYLCQRSIRSVAAT